MCCPSVTSGLVSKPDNNLTVKKWYSGIYIHHYFIRSEQFFTSQKETDSLADLYQSKLCLLILTFNGFHSTFYGKYRGVITSAL